MASVIKTISSKTLSFMVNRFRWVVIIWAIIVLLIGFLVVILPKWHELSKLGLADYKTEQNNLKNKQDYLAEQVKMINAYNNINQIQIDELAKILPSKEDFSQIFVMMSELAKTSGFELQSIDITKEASVEQTTAQSETAGGKEVVKAVGQSGSNQLTLKTLNIAISLSGNSDYKQFKKFLDNLEKNLRLIDASSVSFTALGATGGALASGGFNLNLKTYYLE